MATIPTVSKLSASTDKENRISYETDLSTENTNDEIHTDTVPGPPQIRKSYNI